MAETFSEPEPNVIESSAGFSVTVLGRTGMQYTEGRRSVRIDSEVGGASTPVIAMFTESIRVWEAPDYPEAVTAADRDRIVGNIKRAFAARGRELHVQGKFDWGSVALRPPGQPGELLISSELTLGVQRANSYLHTARHSGSAALTARVRPRLSGNHVPAMVSAPMLRVTVTLSPKYRRCL